MLLERGGERIHPHPFAIERNAHGFDAEARQPGQRALIGFLLDENGVSPRQQQAVDEVDGLQRTGRDQDLVTPAGNARRSPELGDEELAQWTIAEWTAVEAVGRERRAFARENRRGRRDETIDRNLVRVVVAANEAVF